MGTTTSSTYTYYIVLGYTISYINCNDKSGKALSKTRLSLSLHDYYTVRVYTNLRLCSVNVEQNNT